MTSKILAAITLFAMLLSTVACQDRTRQVSPARPDGTTLNANTSEKPMPTDRKILVTYFSNTGKTEQLAQRIAAQTGADLYAITPEIPYTPADLNYRDANSRSSRERSDPAVRPRLAGTVKDIQQYDIVFLGYPIWWGESPRIVQTFLESHDLEGKTIIPFVTSGSSGIGSSATSLHRLAPAATWMAGKRFPAEATQASLSEWLQGLAIPIRNARESN